MGKMFGWQKEERSEKLVFKIEVDESIRKIVSDRITNLDSIKLYDGDTLTVSYELNLRYFECVEKLRAILDILKIDEGLVSVDTKELIYGRCLIQELLDTVHELREKLRDG